MSGYSEAELPYLAAADLFPAPAGAAALLERLEATTAVERLAATLQRKDGAAVSVLVAPTRVDFQGRAGWILVLREEGGPLSGAPASGRGETDDDVGSPMRRVRPLVASLFDAGVEARVVTRLVTGVSSGLTRRLVARRLADLGPPPVPFVLMAFGSEARGERTLLSDQDNGLVLTDPPPGEEARVEDYFHRLAHALCDDLARVGYAHCRGETMARHPRWRRPLADWMARFDAWVGEPNPEELLQFNIFFDRRPLAGDVTLAAALEKHVDGLLAAAPAFFFHLAANTLRHRLPLGLFGGIATDDPTGEAGAIDLKAALLPIVGFARLYALRHRIAALRTVDRLERLAAAGILPADFVAAIVAAHETMMRLRLLHQLATPVGLDERESGRVVPADLAPADRRALEDALQRLTALQRRIVEDYPGVERAGA